MMMLRPSFAVWSIAAGIMAFSGAIVSKAQPGDRTVWSGVYTAEQADRGEAAYRESCAVCHGEDLAGIDVAPPLVGSTFLNNWNNTSAGDLHTRIKTTMPLGAPDTLSGRIVADIEAYMFKVNGFPAGELALPPGAPMMANVKIVATNPAH
jgi:mono/diheme cytochrome c family protein